MSLLGTVEQIKFPFQLRRFRAVDFIRHAWHAGMLAGWAVASWQPGGKASPAMPGCLMSPKREADAARTTYLSQG
jgi:hypothetical protein